jgi:hypothetical protein
MLLREGIGKIILLCSAARTFFYIARANIAQRCDEPFYIAALRDEPI